MTNVGDGVIGVVVIAVAGPDVPAAHPRPVMQP
jgi:hypothetical protein